MSAPVAATVTINGNNFNTTPAGNIVFFGAVKADVTSATATSLVVTVPVGASYQPITVTVNGLTAYSAQPFILTFAGGGAITAASFTAGENFTTDLHPNGIATTDLDGDGKVDVVTPNNYSTNGFPASISVLKNIGSPNTISFAGKKDIPTGVLTYAIAAGDLNGDGKPEIVSSSIVDKTISIFKNTSVPGTISFSSKIDYATHADPLGIAIGDLDGDGRPDIAVVNFLSNALSIYKNTGTAGTLSFAPTADFMTGAGPDRVAIGDLDGDNKPDLVVTNSLSNTISVFKNISSSGNISLVPKTDIVTGNDTPHDVAMGDLNNDGKTDLVVTNNNVHTVNQASVSFVILRNTSTIGNISFAPKLSYATGDCNHARIGDLNGDAKADVVVTNFDQSISIYENKSATSTISLGSPVKYYSNSPYGVDIADWDSDGKPDLAATNFISETVTFFRSKITAPDIISFSPEAAASGMTVTISGKNFSGTTAVSFGGVPAASFTVVNPTTITAVVASGSSGEVVVAGPLGSGTKSGFVYLGPPAVSSFNPAIAGTGDTITITGINFSNASAVSFGGITALSFKVISSSVIKAVVANGGSGSVSVTTPYGTGTLIGFTYLPVPTITSFTPKAGNAGTTINILGSDFIEVSSVTIGNKAVTSFIVNSPVSISALVGEGTTGPITVTTPGGTAVSSEDFVFPAPVITSFTPESGAAGATLVINGLNFSSVKEDNVVYFGAAKAEITAATPTTITVKIPSNATYHPISVTTNFATAFANKSFNLTFPNDGAGIKPTSFLYKKEFEIEGSDPRDLILADVDGDGKSDGVSISYPEGEVSILQNISKNETITFSYPIVYEVDYTTSKIKVADMNNDGKPDIVSTSVNAMSILINTSVPGTISFKPKMDVITGFWNYQATSIGDMDDDGKVDLLGIRYTPDNNGVIAILRNTGVGGKLSFSSAVEINSPKDIEGAWVSIEDLDADGKGEIVLRRWASSDSILVMRNVSQPGVFRFGQVLSILSKGDRMVAGDLDKDGKPELCVVAASSDSVFIFKNTSTPDAIGFAPKLSYRTPVLAGLITIGDLDGDSLPDLAVSINGTASPGLALYQNQSTIGTISFAPYVRPDYKSGIGKICIGDLDGDGKADLSGYNSFVNHSDAPVLKNVTDEQLIRVCAETNFNIQSNISGANYQWQVNDGNGYTNLVNGTNIKGASTSVLQLIAIPVSWNESRYRCLVDNKTSKLSNLIVDPLIRPKGKASSPAVECVHNIYEVTFTETSGVPLYSDLQIWQSINGGPFTPWFSYTYYGYPANFRLQTDTVSIRKYFFKIIPPAGLLCSESLNSDTTTTSIEQFDIPVIKVSGYTLSVANPDINASYIWQRQTAGANWVNLSPEVTGLTLIIKTSGTYRVLARKGFCPEQYSNSIASVYTSISPVEAGNLGIRLYPNPTNDRFTIDTLKLSDNWETLEIFDTDGQKKQASFTIKNKTSVSINIEQLADGFYIAILRRKSGAPVVIKFVKL